MKNAFICFVGIDASGKTTLADRLVKRLNQKGICAKYVWGGYERYILRPLVFIGEKIFLRGTDAFRDYGHYYNAIRKTAKNSIISYLYQKLVLTEYILQIFLKIEIPLLLGKTIVLDRYVFDILINLAVNLGYSDDEFKKHLKRFLNYCPKPDLIYFINTPVEIAFKRKNDIPSVEYLELRKNFYLNIAEDHNMIVLDGCKSLTELEEQVQNEVFEYIKRGDIK